MIFAIAAAFVLFSNRMYNIANILKTDYRPSLQKLTILFTGGHKEIIQGEDDIQAFNALLEPYLLNPPEPEPEVHIETSGGGPVITPDVTVATADQGEAETGTDTESEAGEESDAEPSELEKAGIPSDLAALLHAGGVNTVDEALTHPDLQQVEGIGKGRKENILSILNKS
jgi:hypothetical protein